MGFKYKATVLEELARHGVVPGDETPPETAHQFVSNLYIFEIRRLKKRMLAGEIPKENYAKRVEDLRTRYPILSLPIRFWLDPE